MSRTRCTLSAAGLAALAVAIPAQGAAAAPAPSANWQFDESSGSVARDSSPNGNDGAITGAARIPGRFGGALAFDGLGARVVVPRSASLEPDRITVESWVRATGSPGAFRYLVAKGANGCLNGSYGLYTGADGGLQFYVSEREGFKFTASPDAGQGVWDGRWHHVAGTFDGTTARTFLDGAEVGSGVLTQFNAIQYGLASGDDANLGFFSDACSEPLAYNGDIDETRIWPRALASDEIAASHAQGAAGTRRLAETDFSDDAVVHTSRTGPGPNLGVSIVSATGQRRIREVRIAGLTPATSLATCRQGLLALLNPVCDITLSNGAKTATFKLNRILKPIVATTVTLRITLDNGRTVTAVSDVN